MRTAQFRRIATGALLALVLSVGAATPALADDVPAPTDPPGTGFMWDCVGFRSATPCPPPAGDS
ncbi:hypothetical protein [Amycolatopsis pittospori]|uniref:hypothetical protein n=1 Tax=Amycolatopsis pittospori TaxID=2749434 RepID=UPI0015F01C74|nr:hypothetical protein [Amycolatopsis pittospori]